MALNDKDEDKGYEKKIIEKPSGSIKPSSPTPRHSEESCGPVIAQAIPKSLHIGSEMAINHRE